MRRRDQEVRRSRTRRRIEEEPTDRQAGSGLPKLSKRFDDSSLRSTCGGPEYSVECEDPFLAVPRKSVALLLRFNPASGQFSGCCVLIAGSCLWL
ncbi:hypothetical protein V9T40_005832 [Parthenolecanium corni]|uniref:Uncharacterized protein n=1 Tax=Parthenolecanium corni TaxID=536013 RepID=A0AAN9TUW2_9HEMI